MLSNWLADTYDLASSLLLVLQILPVARLLRSNSGGRTIRDDLKRLTSAVASDDIDFDRIKPLLKAALADKPQDTLIWDLVSAAAIESTPPRRPIASSLQQTPWRHNTSGFANSAEYRQDIDKVLKEELGPLYVGLPGFCAAFFGGVADLVTTSEAVFQRCRDGGDPLFREGWKGWPNDANQDDVLNWFTDVTARLAAFAEGYNPPQTRRRSLAQRNKPIQGSTGERKMDIGFVSDPKAGKDSRCHWSQILIPGELKSNPSADTSSKAWLDLRRCAREVLAAQDTRRFVLGFTLCGSVMRIWEFDRLGGIASEEFDINKDGLQFVSTILGFLWMSDKDLGFDPTINTSDGDRYIEIKRNDRTERLILDRLMGRAKCIAGRATTCWKAHYEKDPRTPLVIKDSWQYTERVEEGELLREATDKGVINVARYYHHETVRVGDADDDVARNVRKGLDVSKATNYRPDRSMLTPSTTTDDVARSSGGSGKRSSSEAGAALPPSKRSCPASPAKASTDGRPNRIHRRVIVRDYGKPVYEASSRPALLAALEHCIEGHESLYNAGFLHRDISINNLMINEDDNNSSWGSFLIDLDLAVRETPEEVSGARSKTGTRAFMAIGVLLGEQHSFMHDLESIFWVLFWICIHYDGPDRPRVVTQFDTWNYVAMGELAKVKLGTVLDEDVFRKTTEEFFTEYYKPLLPWIGKLRRTVFPDGGRWKREDKRLYSSMKEVLRQAQEEAV